MNKEFIGVIVSNSVFSGISEGNTRFENLDFYEEAGKMYGVTPCFFRLIHISKNQDHIEAFVKVNDVYEKMIVPTPKVIYNRALTHSNRVKARIENLAEEGLTFFNQINRFSKLEIHQKLSKKDELVPYLPTTVIANEENIWMMLELFPKLVLKPDNNSLGMGVMTLERFENEKMLTYYDKQVKGLQNVTFYETLPEVLLETIISKSYIIQERIPLASFQSNLFDLRVSVQKNHQGTWQMTGMVAKVAKPGFFVTNVERGGSVFPLENVIYGVFPKVKTIEKNEQLSLDIAKQLEIEIPSLADLGLDIGLTSKGDPMFIECNGRDFRTSYKNAGMYETWKATHTTPIGYGKYLLDKYNNLQG